jgi:hypothetical protein
VVAPPAPPGPAPYPPPETPRDALGVNFGAPETVRRVS